MADVINLPVNLSNHKDASSDSRLEMSIAQADAGELVNWDEAEKWIESWGIDTEIPRPEPKRR